METEYFTNGIYNWLIKRDEQLIEKISKKLSLDPALVEKEFITSGKSIKNKNIKLQARKVKNGKKRKDRAKSGYGLYCSEHRHIASKKLAENENERKFKNKKGDDIEINSEEFIKGVPKFEHVTKKLASMWWSEDLNTREMWDKRAKNLDIKEEPKVKVDTSLRECRPKGDTSQSISSSNKGPLNDASQSEEIVDTMLLPCGVLTTQNDVLPSVDSRGAMRHSARIDRKENGENGTKSTDSLKDEESKEKSNPKSKKKDDLTQIKELPLKKSGRKNTKK
jgi:hypothetical protein